MAIFATFERLEIDSKLPFYGFVTPKLKRNLMILKARVKIQISYNSLHNRPELPWGQRSESVTISIIMGLFSPQIMKIKRRSNQFWGAF